jgi:DNA-binding response OmpR family regulator
VIIVPWRPGELRFRLARLLERKAAPTESPNVIRAGDLVIDSDRYDVYLAGRPVLLTFKEYELLKLLAANPGRVYSREALLEQVWGYRYFGGTRTVDVHVRRLRSKIDDATHNLIETVWNVGYRFHG